MPADPLRRQLVVALAGAALVAAPVSSLAKGKGNEKGKAKVYVVEIRDMAFAPLPPLHVGDTVEWVNADIFRHTATARDGSFDVDLAPKARAWTTFHKPLSTAFYCRFHPGMTGAVTVSG